MATYFLTFHSFFQVRQFSINDDTVFGTKTTMRLLSRRPGGTISEQVRQFSTGLPECLEFWWGQGLLMEQVLLKNS